METQAIETISESKTQWPLVSICVPNYNYAGYITRSLDSILEESYPNKEIVILDDGSSDDSDQVILQWIEEHPDIPVTYERQSNQGITKTFNRLVTMAKGQYLVWLASDDCLSNDGIRHRYEYLLQNPHKLAVFGDCIVVDSDERVLAQSGLSDFHKARKEQFKNDAGIRQEFISNWSVPGPVLMVDRRIYDAIGPYDESLGMEDWDFYLRMAAQNKIGFLDTVVSTYRVHGTNHCMDPKRRLANIKNLLYTARKNMKLFSGWDKFYMMRHYLRYWLKSKKLALKQRF